jgi:sugar lactone lactonase YvrE
MSRPWVELAAVVGLAVLLTVSMPLVASSSAASTHVIRASVTPAAAGSITAFPTGLAASLAIGQPNLAGETWTTPNQSAFSPGVELAAMAPNGALWVIDYPANRAMEFLPPFSTGMAASVVIGQSNFTGDQSGSSSVNLSAAAGLTVDAHGDLWVADSGNNRILEFVPPFRNGMVPSLVIGQTDFEGHERGSTAVNVSDPVGLSFDAAGDLWVADTGNNRVIEYFPPFSTGMAASVVIGQQNMTGNQGGLSQANLSTPFDAEMSNNILWVADGGNNRVVGFQGPVGTGLDASYVLGQPDYTTNSATGAAALDEPLTVSSDSFGNLWVSDSLDNRVVEFSPPFDGFENPTASIGQTTLSGILPGHTATTLDYPFGAFVSAAGDLWVTDADNDRVLEYVPTVFPVQVTPVGLRSGALWTVDLNGVSETGTGTLTFSETNGSYPLVVTPIAGYRADPSTEIVYVNGTAAAVSISFSATTPNPFSAGMAATIVLGEPNFTSNFYYQTASANVVGGNLYAAAFDASGDLWVAEGSFNRVVEYKPPFSNDMAASVVLGQTNLTDRLGQAGPRNLSFPDGLAFTPTGDLFVANFYTNQVVEFAPPFTTGMAASVVIGQSSFTGSESGINSTNLSGPSQIAYAGGSLWVADYENNRILEFPGPVTTGEAASLVLGQSSLSGYRYGTTAVNLSEPDAVAFDSAGNLWAADYGNNRVLRYDAPFTTGESASVVIGQPNMTTFGSDYPSSLDGPNSVWVDALGNVWVADSLDNRVLEYPGPAPNISSNESASEVIGQGNLTSYGPNATATGLDYPDDAITDAHGDLWVVDAGNDRVLGYVPSQFDLNFTENGLPAATSWGVTVNGVSPETDTGSVGLVEQNGTFSWSANPVSGYVASPASGTATVNGAGSTVAITYAPFTYAVTFSETGLGVGRNWSISIGGSSHSSTTATIVVQEPNGTFSYTVAPVSGYSVSASSGSVVVSSGPKGVAVTFSSTASTPLGLAPVDILVLVIVVVVVAVAVATVLLLRRGKGGASSPPAAPPAPGAATPPPGAVGPPPPSG